MYADVFGYAALRDGDGDEMFWDIGFGACDVVRKLQNIEEFLKDAKLWYGRE